MSRLELLIKPVESKKVTLQSLKPGTVFKHQNLWFVKLNPLQTGTYNVMDLGDYQVYKIDLGTPVICCKKASLEIEP